MTIWAHQWQGVADIVDSSGNESGIYPFLASTDIIHELLHVADNNPKAIAIGDADRTITYQSLIAAVRSFAGRLHRNGVSEGDRVVFSMPNSIEFVIAFFACCFVGAIAVPLNPVLGSQERRKIVLAACPKLILTLEKHSRIVCRTAEETAVTSWELYNNKSGRSELPAVQHDRVATIMYTSGTTGVPKGVVLTNRNLLISVISYQRIFHLSPYDRTLVVVPLFHVTGLVGQLLAVLLMGGTVVLVPKFSAGLYFEQVRAHRISFIFAVPTILTLGLYRADNHVSGIKSLRVVASGGAPIAEDLMARIVDGFPEAQFYNTYGMTEVASPATILPPEAVRNHLDSVGLPVPGMHLRVAALDDGVDLGPGQLGQLLMRGPMVTSGYWNNRAETEKAFRDGWLQSGDIAAIDSDGFVRIGGRIKEMINRGGEKVYPADIERPLLEHPAVMQAAVYGVPDEIWGERVYAAVSFKPGMSAEKEELTAWLENRVASFKIPEEFFIFRELPLNMNGKVDKQVLQRRFQKS